MSSKRDTYTDSDSDKDQSADIHGLGASVARGIKTLTDALATNTACTLSRCSHLQTSIDQLELQVSQAALDLHLITNSLFVENLSSSYEPGTCSPLNRAEECPPDETPPAPEQSEALLVENLNQTERSSRGSGMVLPHVYGTVPFDQDSDVGLNSWSLAPPGQRGAAASSVPARSGTL